MWIEIPGFDAFHAFSTRQGGVSPPPFDALDLSLVEGEPAASQRRALIDENARRFAKALGVDISRIATVKQIHGTRIVEVVTTGVDCSAALCPNQDRIAFAPEICRTGLGSPLAQADGLITRARRVALAIRTADCAPILIASRAPTSPPAVAALHAGWRGTLGQIAGRAVRLFSDLFHIAPAHLTAALGPCIGPCCYEVSQALAQDFEACFGADCIARVRGQPHLDLQLANRQALLRAGVPPAAIYVSRHCTACEAGLFFSHRRDQGRTGRHLSLIALP